ncbi:MAG: leucyl aminopeptidase [Planctomycetota bacterium]
MTIRVKLETGAPGGAKQDMAVVLLHEGEAAPKWADAATGGAAGRAVKLGDFKGKAKSLLVLYGDAKLQRVCLAGLGPRAEGSAERVRRAVGLAVRRARELEAARITVCAGGDPQPGGQALVAAAAEAAVLADYDYDELKGEPKPRKKLEVAIHGAKGSAAALSEAVSVAEAVNLARTLGNRPGNVGTPTHLAQQAQAAGKAAGFKTKVLGAAEMKKLGMGALLGVARGSEEPARFIQMEYSPAKRNKRAGTLCLVGKGLTFDSGGISIKPADKMWDMKFDKCGGCAVIGAMSAIARAKLPLRVVGLVPATENMPGGAATKPGDVLRALNKKTIEVQNTDAEGRLILADALAYSARFQPDAILDFATLTGACMIALGDVRAGLMGNDEELIAQVRAAGEAAGDPVWPLPMDDDYGEQVKSEVADVKNLGKGRLAGSIAGGWFLRNFIPEKTAWAHLDIAGVAWDGDTSRGYVAKGATGFGVRLAYAFAKARAGAK